MGTVGSRLIEAKTESFWSLMQVEILVGQSRRTRASLPNAIFEYLGILPALRRALGQLAMIEFKTRRQTVSVAWFQVSRLHGTRASSRVSAEDR